MLSEFHHTGAASHASEESEPKKTVSDLLCLDWVLSVYFLDVI